jgi:hypothetical protein
MTHSIDEARRGVEQSWSGVLAWTETEERLSFWEFETTRTRRRYSWRTAWSTSGGCGPVKLGIGLPLVNHSR